MVNKELQERAINTIRFLSADGVQKANSGHPGLPMGTAAIAYTVWTRHLKINPANPEWVDRDRFVLSGGHGSMLLYSLLNLADFDVSIDDLKNFRQWGSKTPGHPEYGMTPGIDATTGPLGQGLCNGVGMAIAEAHLAAEFNKKDQKIVDHYTYGIVTDGDLMEGVASEAASLAGHLKLGKIIYLYDDNRISIEGSTDIAFTEDRGKRFEAYGWHVLRIKDGNDVEEIDAAINAAKKDPRPSLIICPTTIGYGLPTKAGTAKAHGEPPGEEELLNAKKNMDWPMDKDFYVADDVKELFLEIKKKGMAAEAKWQEDFEAYKKANQELAEDFIRRFEQKLPANWDAGLTQFEADAKGAATRKSSGVILNEIAEKLPEVMGGSADLAPSNNTWLKNSDAFDADNLSGRNIHFGVREHGMAAIINGMAYHKGLLPYGATFLVFSDYLRGALRVAALSHLQTIYVFTHDSIGLGEDGPTHQPVETLAALRAMPNLSVIRPADANETRAAWKSAVERSHGPTALVFTRQNLPTMDRSEFAPAEGLLKGAYVLADLGEGEPEIILMASGSEVNLIVEAGKKLSEEGHAVRLVSFPSWDLFEAQSAEYQAAVLPASIKKRVAVEAGIAMGWDKWVGGEGEIIAMKSFGASAPGDKLFREFGFTVDNVYATSAALLKK